MKLTPSKMLSSMALGALFVAAAGTQTAMAADFAHTAPNGLQVGGAWDATDPTAVDTLQGDIQINGTFTKTVTNIPVPNDDGHYLIVTMPIQLDYTYDADTDILTGAQGVIQNQSVKVETNTQTQQKTITSQPIELSIVSLQEDSSSTDAPVKFVNAYDANDTTNIQVPLQLTVSGPSLTKSEVYAFSALKNGSATVVDIAANTNVNLEIGQIPGQKVQNADLITSPLTTATHNLKFQFEYLGN